MKLNLRRLKKSDYSTLCKWWNDWGMESMPQELLPENGTGGIMVLNKKEPVCAGFVYTTNSKIAWISWIVSSKTYNKKNRKEAINLLLTSLVNMCESTGIKLIYGINNSNRFLTKKFIDIGFIKTKDKMTELIKLI